MATGRIGTNTVLTTRWSKAPAAGTTSLSGLDDNSVSLVYSVGYEAVYRNGVLLSRTNDYTATNGTTITLIDATIAGDIIEVFANQTIPLSDTYSQTVANGKFINNTLTTTTGDIIYASAANTPARLGIGSTGQVLKVSGGVPAWGADSTGALTLITTQSFSNVATATLDNVFSATYNNYEIIIEKMLSGSTNEDLQMVLRYGTTDGTAHFGNLIYNALNSTTWTNIYSSNTTQFVLSTASTGTYPLRCNLNVVGIGTSTRPFVYGIGLDGQTDSLNLIRGYNDSAQTYTGFKLKCNSGNIDAVVSVYGKAK